MRKSLVFRILWGIVGALMIVMGIICLCCPDITVATLSIMFGATLLVSGIVDIVIFVKWNGFMFGAGWFLVDGILTVILSIFLLFNMQFTSLTLPFIFGMWTIFTGIDRFVMSFELKRFGVCGWGWMTAIGIVLAALGFILFLDPVLGALTMTTTVSILLIVRGIAAIVQAIFAGRYMQ